MARKKGGLGQAEAVEHPEDLLDTVFGATAAKPKADTPPPAPAGKAAPDKSPDKADRVGKYFLLDRALAKSLKLYAVENDMKEIAVIEASLRAFLGKPEA